MALEATAALGVASSVCQLIDFASKLLSESYAIYQSGDEKSVKRLQLETAISTITELSASVDASVAHTALGRRLSSEERSLQNICERTRGTSLQLLEVLDEITLTSDNLAWRSFREALSMRWQKQKIDSTLETLCNHRLEINSFLLVLLRWVLHYSITQRSFR